MEQASLTSRVSETSGLSISTLGALGPPEHRVSWGEGAVLGHVVLVASVALMQELTRTWQHALATVPRQADPGACGLPSGWGPTWVSPSRQVLGMG